MNAKQVVKENDNSMQGFIKKMIYLIGDDSDREGVKDTPKRVCNSWLYLYAGYDEEDRIEKMLTQFDGEQYDEMVIFKDIEFYSMCEHHMLPFFGKAHIGYVPDKNIVGVSKLARLLEVYARRLQVQERICMQVTGALMKYLKPKGAGCIIEAKHLCVACRGVEKQHSLMITSSLVGCLKEDLNCRQEFLHLIKE